MMSVAPLAHLLPLSVFSISHGLRPRILMVTDSLGPSSFFGGVGTATLFAGSLANHRSAGLCLVTLRENPYRNDVRAFFDLHRVQVPPKVEFRRVDLEAPSYPLDVGSEDLFVTTSWWSTRNVLGSIAAERIIYILQEDERMFYPAGDEHLRAQETISEPGLRVIVNTRLLYDHLLDTGCQSMREAGTWFEPAFPESAYFFEPVDRSPLNFFFYARPNNPRNLFCRGVEAINKAATSGVLRRRTGAFISLVRILANKPRRGERNCDRSRAHVESLRCPKYVAWILAYRECTRHIRAIHPSISPPRGPWR